MFSLQCPVRVPCLWCLRFPLPLLVLCWCSLPMRLCLTSYIFHFQFYFSFWVFFSDSMSTFASWTVFFILFYCFCFHDFSKWFNHILLRFKYIALLWSILLRLLGPCRDNRSYWWLGLCAGLWDRMIMFLCVDICYCLCSVSVPFLHFWLNSLDISKVWVLFIGRESFYESICGRKE